MVRGTNKFIIEISDTGSQVFEMAILYVRENHRLTSGQSLEQHADKYITAVSKNGNLHFIHKAWIIRAVQLCGSCLAGAAAAILIISL